MAVSTYAKMINQVYKKDCNVSGWSNVARSDSVCIYEKESLRVFAIRGIFPNNQVDLRACATLINNALPSSERYRRDLEFIKQHLTTKESLVIGHSLGGAIADRLCGDGIFKHAITFNSAIEPKFLRNMTTTRYYNPSDFLYLLIGRYATNVHIWNHKTFELLDLVPIFRIWTTHRLEQFIQGYKPELTFQKGLQETSPDYVVQSVVLLKEKFPQKIQAEEWILNHKYKGKQADETHDTWRFRQIDPAFLKTGAWKVRETKLGDVGFLVIAYK